MYTHLCVEKYCKTVFSRQILLKTPISMKWLKNEKNQINVEVMGETLYKVVRSLVLVQQICTALAMQNKCF